MVAGSATTIFWLFIGIGDHKSLSGPVKFKNGFADHIFAVDFDGSARDSSAKRWSAGDVHAFGVEAIEIGGVDRVNPIAAAMTTQHAEKEIGISDE